jgi:hypothetical protein
VSTNFQIRDDSLSASGSSVKRDMPAQKLGSDLKPIALHRATILSVGDDARLLETRQMVLASAGYVVLSMSSTELLNERRVQQTNLAVICHSVLSKRAARVAQTLHRIHPGLPILRLGDSSPEPNGSYEFTFDFPPRPEVLLRTLELLLSGRTESRIANHH